MSAGNRSFVPVSLKGGDCPGDKRHFRGAAREVYGYLKLLGARHGGFVFASVKDITKHTKNWKHQKQSYCYRQCKRILATFRALGVLSKRREVKIHGRTYRGWELVIHDWWAETHGDICDFKQWPEYEESFQKDKQQNVPDDVPGNVLEDVPGNVPEDARNVPQNVPDDEREFAAIV
jgi:hypothetical protein